MAAEYSPDPSSQRVTDVELRCPPNHSVLSLVRMFICDVARRMGFSPEAVGEIELCVDEACANVIDHAYHGLGESDEHRPTRLSNDADFPHVGVLISIAPDSLTITVSDRGRGSTGKFDSSAANLDEYSSRERPRGLGLFIIRKLMDDVRVDFPEPSGTRLVMTKLLQPTRESRQFAEGH